MSFLGLELKVRVGNPQFFKIPWKFLCDFLAFPDAFLFGRDVRRSAYEVWAYWPDMNIMDTHYFRDLVQFAADLLCSNAMRAPCLMT